MPTSMSPMQIKNTVVGKVHTIQSNMTSSPLHAAHCKSLCNVVAHEPNDDGARNDGKRSGPRQRGPIHTRCRYGARPGGDEGLGGHTGQSAPQQRSAERREGTECVSTCRSWSSPVHKKKKQ